MAEFLGDVSDVLLCIHAVEVALSLVEGIDQDDLLPVHLHAVTRECHHDEEVLVWLSQYPLLEVRTGIIDWFFVCDVQKFVHIIFSHVGDLKVRKFTSNQLDVIQASLEVLDSLLDCREDLV